VVGRLRVSLPNPRFGAGRLACDPSTIGDRLRPVTIKAYPGTGRDSPVNACPA